MQNMAQHPLMMDLVPRRIHLPRFPRFGAVLLLLFGQARHLALVHQITLNLGAVGVWCCLGVAGGCFGCEVWGKCQCVGLWGERETHRRIARCLLGVERLLGLCSGWMMSTFWVREVLVGKILWFVFQ